MNEVLGAEQTQSESVAFVPVNLQFTERCRAFSCSGVWNYLVNIVF